MARFGRSLPTKPIIKGVIARPTVTFMEPGGDADFGIALWPNKNGSPAVATDFVNGGHQRSIKYGTGNVDDVFTAESTITDAGSRISVWMYFNALPTTATAATLFSIRVSGTNTVVRLRMTQAGVLQLWEASVQIGSNGSTLSTGTWYRISLAYTITSTTVNRFELFKNGTSDISVTNATITNTTSSNFVIGNIGANSTLDFRSSDHYIDNSASLIDTGNVWVTAKRPNANGTTNGFTTQIGSGGSGYGTGHSPQINERALSTTNGWSIVGAGSAVTEEYSIESISTGDIDITGFPVLEVMGWVYASSLLSETAQIIVKGISSNISVTSTNTMFTAFAYSTAYPVGGTDIGITTSTTVTTVSLYECGIVIAYVPPVVTTIAASVSRFLSLLGIGH